MRRVLWVGFVTAGILGFTVRTAAINGDDFDILRGDANNDNLVDVTDVVFIRTHLFLGGPAPVCEDMGDANDDGLLDLTDSVYLEVYLFLGGPPPAAPYPYCGPDETADDLAACYHDPGCQ